MNVFGQLKKNAEENGLFSGTRRVIAAVSGGADSVFLFYFLLGICCEKGIALEAVHVNHGIRGDEADGDEEFVRQICESESVPFIAFTRSIPDEAAEKKISYEAAGREARYEIFERLISERGEGTSVALAHHANDQAETVLMNLSRGTGLTGLGGLSPARGRYIRPLLGITRETIEKTLKRMGIAWREDSTNKDDDAARNRVRHHIVPALEDMVNKRAAEHIAEAASSVREAVEYIRREIMKRADVYIMDEDVLRRDETLFLAPGAPYAVALSRECLAEHPAIQSGLVREAVKRASGTLTDVEAVHVRAVLELIEKGQGRADIGRGVSAFGMGDKTVIAVRRDGEMQDTALFVPGEELPVEGKTITVGDVSFAVMRGIRGEAGRYTTVIDCDTIKGPIVARTRKRSDRIALEGGGSRSISDCMTDRKIPPCYRDHVLLFASGDEVIRIIGGRRGRTGDPLRGENVITVTVRAANDGKRKGNGQYKDPDTRP